MVQELPYKEIGCNTERHNEAYHGMPSPQHQLNSSQCSQALPQHLFAENTTTHSLVTKALTSPSHLLHDLVEQSNLLGPQRLKSLHPFSRHSVRLVNSQFDICESWITDWQQVSLPAHLNIAPDTALPPGAELPRKEWVSLNRLRTGVGRFGVFMYRWGLRQSAACQCGAPEQTAQHLMNECPIFCLPVDLNLCHEPGPSTRE